MNISSIPYLNTKLVNIKKQTPLYLKETSLNMIYGFLCGLVFYRNVIITVIMILVFGVTGYVKGKKYEKTEKMQIDENHFYEFLIELAQGLDAGSNIVNVIVEIHCGLPDGRVKQRLVECTIKLGINYSLDEVFQDFAEHFDSDVIKNWSRIIALSYKNGANLQKAIRENRDLFVLKRRARKEVAAIMAKQRFNFFIIKYMPFFIILLLVGSADDFSAKLYGPGGRIVMSIALGMILVSELIAEKISKTC